ncbi:FkbM family methyltransferase [Chelatococcus reniformis]|uniref:Methyltransferase FkbM domain-containing protein n=1 Tax=Chelatococcus reniformis TaxID=1494448 RepID=A0A916U330_9HYPH|nr:FkbM family methyltransferase [Chelatococcus reniformis]GGC58441.1 hypothetical protein GCM10010994_16720 [Chelatococcus reniformis]
MQRVSYAQTGQDVLTEYLLRKHRRIPHDKDYKGTYVDVGACYPVRVSNTYYFYQRGWDGICIDANPDTADEFAEKRPRDHFDAVAISDQEAELPFYIFRNPQLNCFDPNRKRRMAEHFVKEVTVRSRPLSSVIADSPLHDRPIDFMSIDTEGHELNVLRSLDFDRHAPKLVVLECIADVGKAPGLAHIKYLVDKGYKLIAHTGHDAFMLRELDS